MLVVTSVIYFLLDAAISCPICHDSPPSDFTELYCNSSTVYKLSTRKGSHARLLINMSPGKPAHRIRKLAKLMLEAVCMCRPLEKGKIWQEYRNICFLPSYSKLLSLLSF